MWQLQLSNLDNTGKEIGRYIIGNIDPDGYLKASVDNIIHSTHGSGKRY
jgi:DNA-directed RNA polymerase specialized sigma54-like protein